MVMGINLQVENLHLGELWIEFLIFKKLGFKRKL